MAAITGHDGDVTFANGYTTDAYSWTITDGGTTVETTPFQPAGDSMTRTFAIGDASGEYRCRMPATINTDLSQASGFYTENVHSFTFEATAQDLLTTAFGRSYNTRISGLYSATGSYDCYLDGGVAIPERGQTDNLTLTIDTGQTYLIPTLIREVNARASTDGTDRHITVSWESSGNFSETGTPVVGAAGAATFVADTGREYTGNILVIRVSITMTAQRDPAEFTIGFVGNGQLTPA